MSPLPPWDDLRRGKDCPLDDPRPDFTEFVYFVRRLSVSSLYLRREQTYRGACALVYDTRHRVRIGDLSLTEWTAFSNDMWLAERAIWQSFRPDHINIESLGNTVPHLHWHIIPRYKNDGRWGGPIWTTELAEMPDLRLQDAQYAGMAGSINSAIDANM